jgi:uncharacterized cupin superfamily protein
MKRFNWNVADLEPFGENAPSGFGGAVAEIGSVIGGEHLAGAVYEVPPGNRLFPYHWEAAQEEWLLVLTGRPTVRHPEGEQELRPGDLVCFATGPGGAHQVRNDTDEPARVLMLSDVARPNVVVYPDSGKVGVRVEEGLPASHYALDAALGYWDGEQ